ncbi:MAG: hypothetical protein ACI9WU_002795, partial [Myxococcota bacterium]
MNQSVEPDNWEHYVEPENGETPTMSITYARDMTTDARPRGYSQCYVIASSFSDEECMESGLPHRSVLEEYLSIQYSMTRSLELAEIECLLVAMLTGGNTRRLLFQVKGSSEVPFVDTVQKQLDTSPFPSRMALAAEDWELFDRAVAPDEDQIRQIQTRYAIEALEESGFARGGTVVLEHVFEGSEAALNRLEESLCDDDSYFLTERKENRV